jgi:hypothetical protein
LASAGNRTGRDRDCRPVDLDCENLDGLADVPQRSQSERADLQFEGVSNGTFNNIRDTDAPRVGQCLDARRHVDAVPLDGFTPEKDLAEIDANSEGDRFVIGVPYGVIAELALNGYRELERLRGAFEQCEDAITCDVLDAPTVIADQRPDQSQGLGHALVCALFIPTHESAIAVHVREQDGCNLSSRTARHRFRHSSFSSSFPRACTIGPNRAFDHYRMDWQLLAMDVMAEH